MATNTLPNGRRIDSLDDLADVVDDIRYALRDGDFAPAFERISEDLERQHDRMFQRGQEADGTPWKPLKARTIKRKGHGIILIEFEDLYRSLVGFTADSVRVIYRQDMEWGTADYKAIYHQQGTKFMPARPPVGISDETLDRAAEHVADRCVELALGVMGL